MNAAHSEVAQPMQTNPGESLRQAREIKGWSAVSYTHLTLPTKA